MYEYRRDYETFQLECWGNGLAYALTHKPTNMQVYVQGDDALQFEQERELVEKQFPDMTNEEVLSYLWNICEYELAAVQK